MKSYIKGMITGIIISAVICSIPAFADTIDVLFNNVRINVNGVDRIQWGENITSGGEETPSSILYNGTTYLPMRKLGELNGNKIYWNGDSRTAYMTGAQTDIKVIAEKPDKNGNVWKYYTFKDSSENCYLGVKDEARGYERVYLMPSTTVSVKEDAVYFARISPKVTYKTEYETDIIKLEFLNDENHQDGEIIKNIGRTDGEGVFDGDYFFYVHSNGGTSAHSELTMYNYITCEHPNIGYRDGSWTQLTDLKIADSTEEKTVLDFAVHYATTTDTDKQTVTFDKTVNSFSK